MNDATRDAAQKIAEACGPAVSIVLVGSAARGKRTEQSDIDILVIGQECPEVPRITGFHIHEASLDSFKSHVCRGDDFEISCLRFGAPLYDKGIWAQLVNSPYSEQWPDWRVKVVHGARRLFLANALLEMGDADASTEELLYVLGHAARGILLKFGIFPLSRPELAEQVRTLGYPHLALLHEQLRNPTNVSQQTLRNVVRYAKKLLCDLDRATYERCSEDFQAKRQAKADRLQARGQLSSKAARAHVRRPSQDGLEALLE